jgi:hypothetical protein
VRQQRKSKRDGEDRPSRKRRAVRSIEDREWQEELRHLEEEELQEDVDYDEAVNALPEQGDILDDDADWEPDGP